MAVTFDTLKASRRLQQAGFDEAKAEAIVSIFAEDVGTNLATKDDLAQLEQRLTIRMGAVVAGGVEILLAGMGVVTAIILSA